MKLFSKPFLIEKLFPSWNRWGRVGELGQNNGLEMVSDVNKGIKAFEKKFKDKTRHDWTDRKNFKPSPGKYTLIEMDGGGGEDEHDAYDDEEPETKVDIFPKSNLNLLIL